jgi:hypothetical protein
MQDVIPVAVSFNCVLLITRRYFSPGAMWRGQSLMQWWVTHMLSLSQWNLMGGVGARKWTNQLVEIISTGLRSY